MLKPKCTFWKYFSLWPDMTSSQLCIYFLSSVLMGPNISNFILYSNQNIDFTNILLLPDLTEKKDLKVTLHETLEGKRCLKTTVKSLSLYPRWVLLPQESLPYLTALPAGVTGAPCLHTVRECWGAQCTGALHTSRTGSKFLGYTQY